MCVKPSSETSEDLAIPYVVVPSLAGFISPSIIACNAVNEHPSSASDESKFLISNSLE